MDIVAGNDDYYNDYNDYNGNAWVHLHPVALLQLHAMHSPFIKKNVYTWIEEKNLTTQFV